VGIYVYVYTYIIFVFPYIYIYVCIWKHKNDVCSGLNPIKVEFYVFLL